MTDHIKPTSGVALALPLLLLAFLFNEWTLARTLSPDGVFSESTLFAIRLFDGALVGMAVLAGALQAVFVSMVRTSARPERFRNLARALPRATAIVFIGSALEVSFLVGNELAASRTTWEFERLIQFDAGLGYRHIPGVRVASRKFMDGKPVFDVTYAIDEAGRRVVPQLGALDSRDRYLLMFGGSYTFGHGVADDETLPYFVARDAPRVHPYNFGVAGYGPQQVLVQLSDAALKKGVVERDGSAVYIYIPDQVCRAIVSMRVVTNDGRHFPCFVEDDKTGLKNIGSFSAAYPRLARAYTWIAEEQILKYHNVDIPLWLGKRHLRLTASIIAAARDAYRDAFGNDSYYVILWPRAPWDAIDVRAILPYLSERGVRVLDYSELVDARDETYRIEGDGHPNGRHYEVVAHRLVRDLEPAVEHASR